MDYDKLEQTCHEVLRFGWTGINPRDVLEIIRVARDRDALAAEIAGLRVAVRWADDMISNNTRHRLSSWRNSPAVKRALEVE